MSADPIRPEGLPEPPRTEAEVEGLLARCPAVRPRQEFRSALKRRFLSGDFGASVEERLTAWRVPPARPEFRTRLRAQFVAAGAAPARPAAPLRSVRRLRRYGVLAAALLLIFAIAPIVRGTDPVWEIVPTTGVDSVVIDGEVIPATDQARICGLLNRGDCHLRAPSEVLRMIRDRALFLELEPDSVLYYAPGGQDRIELELSQGAVRVSMGASFDEELVVSTPDQRVFAVRGSAVAIEILEDGATCICCLDGSVELLDAHGRPTGRVLEQGTSTFFAAEEAEGERIPRVVHADALEAARTCAARYLELK